MTDTQQTDLSWAVEVVEASTKAPWVTHPAWPTYFGPPGSDHDGSYHGFCYSGPKDAAAIALLGSVGRELLAVVEAFDSIEWMAREYANAGGLYSLDKETFTAAMKTRDKLRAALAAARERAGR